MVDLHARVQNKTNSKKDKEDNTHKIEFILFFFYWYATRDRENDINISMNKQ